MNKLTIVIIAINVATAFISGFRGFRRAQLRDGPMTYDWNRVFLVFACTIFIVGTFWLIWPL